MRTLIWVWLTIFTIKSARAQNANVWELVVGRLNSSFYWSDDLNDIESENFIYFQTVMENEIKSFKNKTIAVIDFQRGLRVKFTFKGTDEISNDELHNLSSIYFNLTETKVTIFQDGPVRDDSNVLYQDIRFPILDVLNTSSSEYQNTVEYLESYTNCLYVKADNIIEVIEIVHAGVLANFIRTEHTNFSSIIGTGIFDGQIRPKLGIEELGNTSANILSNTTSMPLFDGLSCAYQAVTINSWRTLTSGIIHSTSHTTTSPQDITMLPTNQVTEASSTSVMSTKNQITTSSSTSQKPREHMTEKMKTPSEKIDEILEALITANNQSMKIDEHIFTNAVEGVAEIMESSTLNDTQNSKEEFQNFANAIDTISSLVEIPEGENSITVEIPNLSLVVTDVNNAEDVEQNLFFNNTVIASVAIPKSVLSFSGEKTRVTVAVFSGLAISTTSEGSIDTIISIKVGDEKVENLQEKIAISFPATINPGKNSIPETLLTNKTVAECVFYDDQVEQWSTRGCFLGASKNPVTCYVDHLTSFAVIVSSSQVRQNIVLGTVSQVGCILSILGFFFTIVLYLYSKKWRRNRPSLELLHVCVTLLIAYVIFVTGVGGTSNRRLCIATVAFLQYFYLTAWCWIGIYTRDMYISLVKVYSSRGPNYTAKVTVLAYGIPLLIVSIHLAITVGHFDNQTENVIKTTEDDIYRSSTYYSESACWLHGYSLYIGFLLPVGIILIHNICSVVVVMYEVGWKSSSIQSNAEKRGSMSKIRLAGALGILVGTAWVFGFLFLVSEDVVYSQIMGWLFTVFNASQGVFLFFLLCIRPKDMRRVWLTPIRRTISHHYNSTKRSSSGYSLTSFRHARRKSYDTSSSIVSQTSKNSPRVEHDPANSEAITKTANTEFHPCVKVTSPKGVGAKVTDDIERNQKSKAITKNPNVKFHPCVVQVDAKVTNDSEQNLAMI